MIGFCCSLAMEKKIISYGIVPIFFDLVRNILCIWYSYCMFILLAIIIGLDFVIVFNFHRFNSFFLPLFIWSYFTEKWSLFSPFRFWSWNYYRTFFFAIFNGFVCCRFMWFILVVTSTLRTAIIAFLLSLLIVPVSTFPINFGVSAILRLLFLSQTLCSIVETWRSVVQVPFLLSRKHFYSFFLLLSCSFSHNSIMN